MDQIIKQTIKQTITQTITQTIDIKAEQILVSEKNKYLKKIEIYIEKQH